MRSLHRFLLAFRNAFAGLFYFFLHERNGRVQAAIGFATIVAGTLFRIDEREWIVIVGCVGAVLAAEMFNSAIEKTCDLIEPGIHPQIKIIKDLSAAAVLWLSIVSAAIGLIIFLPKIFYWL